MMLTRCFGLLTALSVATAWPIFFYENRLCNHYPVFTLEGPTKPNTCNLFGHVNIQSFSGGTGAEYEKVLLYDDVPTCYRDAAHRAYANHTIGNYTNLCVPFHPRDIPRAYVFIEELLGPVSMAEAASNSECHEPALVVQD